MKNNDDDDILETELQADGTYNVINKKSKQEQRNYKNNYINDVIVNRQFTTNDVLESLSIILMKQLINYFR